MDDSLPLDLGFLEIDPETHRAAGGSQVVETLGGVLVGQAIHTFQLKHQHIFDEDIRKVFAGRMAFVTYGKRGLDGSSQATKAEFSQQRTFVDFLQKSGAQCVGDFKDGAQHLLSQRIHESAFIGVQYLCARLDQSFSETIIIGRR